MARLNLSLVILLLYAVMVLCADNDTTSTTPSPVTTPKPPPPPSNPAAGIVSKAVHLMVQVPKMIATTCSDAIASFLKMLVDVPLALVEAFRDLSVSGRSFLSPDASPGADTNEVDNDNFKC
ncbi:unnamed protein product, partial [Iphiclides podalirius]